MDDIEEFDGKLWEKHTGDGNPRGIIAGEFGSFALRLGAIGCS